MTASQPIARGLTGFGDEIDPDTGVKITVLSDRRRYHATTEMTTTNPTPGSMSAIAPVVDRRGLRAT
jgi:hypothetical protein